MQDAITTIVGVTLGILWVLVLPLALLYGQYWSAVNILLNESLSWPARVGYQMAFDVTSLVFACLWIASLRSAS